MKISWKKRIIGLLLISLMMFDTASSNCVYAQAKAEDFMEQSIEAGGQTPEEEQIQEEKGVNEEEDVKRVEQNVSEKETYKEWEYFVDENNCVHITAYSDVMATDLMVPVKIGKKPVTAIEEGAFQSLNNLEKINISMYVTDIGENVFSDTDVSINAYHGTFALGYAENHGINYTDLSEYDFAADVIDMTEIIPMDYSFVDVTDIRMNLLEAEQIKEGSVIYLPPSDSLPNGDAFKVLSIEDTTDNQVILRCERAIGGEAVNSIHIKNEKLLPDWENAVYYYDADMDGEYEEYSFEGIQPYMEISGNASERFSKTFKDDFELSGKGEFVSGRIKAGYNVTFGITATANIDMEIGLSDISVENFDIGIEEIAEGNIYLEGSCSAEVPIAEIPLTSVGVATVYAELSLHCSAEGKISYQLKYTAKQGVKYDSARQELKPYCNFSKNGSSTGTVNANCGLQLELGVNVIFLGDVVKADADIGINAAYSQSSRHKECTDISVSLYAKITAGTDFKSVPGELAKRLSVTLTILDKKYPLSNEHYEKINNQLQYVPHCKYTSYEVSFYTGKSFDISPQYPENNEKVIKPEVTETQCAGDTLLGWNTGEGTSYWDFEKNVVNKDVTLFAVWASEVNSKKTVTYKAEGCSVFQERYVPGTHIAEPSTPKRLDYIFQGWFKDETFNQKFDFVNSVMPNQDITLYGKWKYISGYNPWDISIPLISEDNFEYKIIDDEVVITKYKGVSYGVTIPSEIEGYPVVEIADGVFSGKSFISSIIIPESVKRLGNSCFSNCTKLNTVEGAGGLEKLGSNCFYKCVALNKIEIADTLVWIGTNAFSGCTALKEISLPSGLKEIPEGCFDGCTGLSSVQLPNYVEVIGNEAFAVCSSLGNVILPSTVKSIGNYTFRYSGLNEIVLPENVENIGNYAFANTDIKNISFQTSKLTQISSNAFTHCSLVESIVIPDGVKTIGSSAFSGCSNLECIRLPGTIEYISESAFSSTAWYKGQPEGLLYLDGYLFGIKGEIIVNSQLNIEEGTICVTDYAFGGNKDIMSIQFPESLQRIGDYAFSNCSNISEVSLEGNMDFIGSHTFDGCVGLKKVIFPQKLNRIESFAFYNCNGLENINLFGDMESIGTYAFYGCTRLKKVQFPTKLNEIDDYAFRECSGLENVIFSENLSRIGREVFKNCINLNNFTLPSTLESIGSGAFSECQKITEIRFPEKLKSVGYNAFENCVNLSKIVYDSGEVNGDYNAFYGAGKNVEGIALVYSGKVKNISGGKESYGSIYGPIKYSDINILSIEIGENVESIDNYAFYYSNYASDIKVFFNAKRCMQIGKNVFGKFSSLKIGNGVTRIPDEAFYEQSELSDIKFMDENSLIYIGDRAFHDTNWKKNVDSMQEGAYYIGHCLYQYYGAYQGEDIVFRDGTTMVCYEALENQRKINSVTFPSTLKYIGGKAFAGMNPTASDPKVGFDFSYTDLEYIGDAAFYRAYVGDIMFNKKIKHIGERAFAGVSRGMVSIPEYMTELKGEYDLFYSMYIPETVTSISGIAFSEYKGDYIGTVPKRYLYCKKGSYAEQYAKEHNYPCYYVFDEYPYLALSEDKTYLLDFVGPTKKIILPESVTSYNKGAFGETSQISLLEDRIDYEGVESLAINNDEQTGISYFSSLKNLKTLIIGKNVQKLPYGFIQQFPNLEQVVIETGNQNYKIENDFVMSMNGEELFFYNGQKNEVHVPKSVQIIYNHAFLHKGNIKVIIDADVRLTEDDAFEGSKPTICDISGSFFEEYAKNNGFSFQTVTSNKKASYRWCHYSSFGGCALSLNKETGQLAFYGNEPGYYGYGYDDGKATEFIEEYGETVNSIYVNKDCSNVSGEVCEAINLNCENLDRIEVDKENTKFLAENSILYCHHNKNDMVSYAVICSAKNITEAVLNKNTSDIWYSAFYGCKKLKSVEIPDGVESLGNSVFRECSSLESVTLPDGVESLGDNVFRECSSLENIALPDSIKWIGDLTFYESALKINHLPKSLTHIGFYAFARCEIDTITIPFTVDYIDDKAFHGTGLENVFGVPESYAQTWAERNGYLFNPSTIDEVGVYQNYMYKIEDGEATITGFYDEGHSSGEIPEKIVNIPVAKIGENAFYGNTSIGRLSIPAGVREIGNGAIEKMSNLREIIVDENNEFFSSESGVLFNKERTELFLYPQNKYDSTYTIPDSVIEIRKGAFESCNLRTLVLNNGLEKIGDKAFYGSSYLQTVTMPSTLKEIGIWAFWNAKKLKMRGPLQKCVASDYAQQYYIPYNNYTVKLINGYTTCIKFEQQAGTYIENPLKDISKNDYTLSGWYIDRECTVPWDFDNNPMPEEDLTLYAGWICDYQYESCDGGICITGTNKNSKYYTIPSKLDGKSVIAIAEGAFGKEDIATVHIPSSVTDIAENACHEGIIIYGDEGSAAEIYAKDKDYDFAYQYYVVKFQSNGGSGVKTYSYKKGSLIKEVESPIRDNYAFKGWYRDSALRTKWDFGTDIMPGENIVLYAGWNKMNEAIPDNQFLYVEKDNKIVLKGYRGDSDYIVVPESINGIEVKEIGDMFLQNNDKVTSIVISEGIEEIGKCAFANCGNLSRITLSGTVRNIGEQAFSDCASLKTINLPANLQFIQDNTFLGCTSLRKISMPGSVRAIGESAFEDCENLTGISLGTNLTVIGERAFYNCKNVQEVLIPQNVQAIGQDAFTGCKKLENIFVVPGNEVYTDLNGVLLNAEGNLLVRYPQGKPDEFFEIPEEVTEIGIGAFSYSRFLKEVEITKTVECLGEKAFYSCINLEKIKINQSEVKEIAKNAMAQCKKLKICSLPDELESIGEGAFRSCISLERIRIPEMLSRIEPDSFNDCDVLMIECDENSFAYHYAVENQLNYYYYPETPKAPEVMSKRATSIVLKGTDGYEYSLDGQQWQTCNVFRNLLINLDYTFYQRVAATDKNAVSSSSQGTNVKTSSQKESATDFEISLPQDTYVYTGKEIIPTIKVMWEGIILEENEDYSVAYYNCINVGKAEIVVSGMGDFEGEVQINYDISKAPQILRCTNEPEYITVGDSCQLEIKSYDVLLQYYSEDSSVATVSSEGIIKGVKTGETIIHVVAPETQNFIREEITINISVKKELSGCKISMDRVFFQYDGEEKQPVISVYDGSVFLTADVDYVISDSSDNKADVGRKWFTIEGMGDYVGERTVKYYICECIETEKWEQLESEHNYEDDVCTMWSWKAGDDVSSFEILFDDETFFEENCDFLYLYTYDNKFIGEYTGDELSGMSVLIESSGVKILLLTDGSETEWGYKVSDIKDIIKKDREEIKNISDCIVKLDSKSYVYNGKAHKPSIIIKDGSEILKMNTDYIVSYKNNINAGQAEILISGKGNYTGSIIETFTIQKADQKIYVSKTINKQYGNKPFSLKVKRSAGNGKLSFASSNKKIAAVNSKGKLSIKGIGETKITISAAETSNYKKKNVKVTIKVRPANQKISSIKVLKGKRMIVRWKMDKNGTGYQIQYSTDKKFKRGVKNVIIHKNTTASKTIKNLKNKKKYYVRIRTYKTVSEKKYYSGWSKMKSITTK